MNRSMIDGWVGSIKRKGAVVYVRLCHKEAFFSKKEKDWIRSEDWYTLTLFDKKGEAFERDVLVGDRILAECQMSIFPKTGPTSRICLSCVSFYVLQAFGEAPSYKGTEITDLMEGIYDEDEGESDASSGGGRDD